MSRSSTGPPAPTPIGKIEWSMSDIWIAARCGCIKSTSQIIDLGWGSEAFTRRTADIIGAVFLVQSSDIRVANKSSGRDNPRQQIRSLHLAKGMHHAPGL